MAVQVSLAVKTHHLHVIPAAGLKVEQVAPPAVVELVDAAAMRVAQIQGLGLQAVWGQLEARSAALEALEVLERRVIAVTGIRRSTTWGVTEMPDQRASTVARDLGSSRSTDL